MISPKSLGTIELVLAALAVVFSFVKVADFLPVLMLALIFAITAVHHFTEKNSK